MSEGFLWNLPVYALGAGAIALMFGWDRIVAWLDRLDPNSPRAGWAASQRSPVKQEKQG